MEKYSVLLTVDAEKFSTHRDTDLPRLHMEIRHALVAACAASGLAEIWRSIRFLESTGDGLLAILPHEATPALIDRFPLQLQNALAAVAPELRAAGLRLRLRVALHAGLVDDARPEAPGVSATTVGVCRLLDSEPLKEALRRSDPEVTFVAFALSEEVFTKYVVGGRTTLRPSQFTPMHVTRKQFSGNAYLYVPTPSTRQEPAPDAARPATPAPPGGISVRGTRIRGKGNQNIIGNNVNGDLNAESS
ncbi:hypothetical protein Ssi03_37300 [Sphaerisporangium siamense]|uniref:Guanylate cyclase domain-containing protein n=1 Tax=Sphaerisporangium siamense TaxID=795645 RepID=A0A7W7D911_9ACTN|nr:hypothetical protein [Sphaerisporangium siamense]MBB4701615.1 hypothetical protein [Sphaerisporangium siamense]GII85740.1 hypothetical protein Ssi03_37300 [Sphaerisporangium siamense]